MSPTCSASPARRTSVRINPRGDTKIIHVHRFPAEVDAHYDVAVGLHADIGGLRISWKMDLEIGHNVDTRFNSPEFVSYATSFGVRGYRIASADEPLPTLREALAADTVIACPVDYSVNSALIAFGELDDSWS